MKSLEEKLRAWVDGEGEEVIEGEELVGTDLEVTVRYDANATVRIRPDVCAHCAGTGVRR